MPRQCIHRESHPELGEIQVWDNEGKRSLWFDDVILQSEIFLDDPAVLPNVVNRAMLAHLMFVDAPGSVLLAGCGGGSIARWFNSRSPDIKGDAVELSDAVIAVAKTYFEFPESWQLHQADIQTFTKQNKNTYDFILVDLEENQWSPDWVSSISFLKTCKKRLSSRGVMTMNLICHDEKEFAQSLSNIKSVFDNALCLNQPEHDNIIVIAFRQKPISPTQSGVAQSARHWGLEFAKFLNRINTLNPDWK